MDFSLPEIGEGVYEAELVRWLVAPGDTYARRRGGHDRGPGRLGMRHSANAV